MRINRLILSLMSLTWCASTVLAQVKNAEAVQALGNGSTAGTDFWISIPPNDLAPFTTQSLEIYVASEFTTNVYVYEALGDRGYTYSVTAGRVLTLTSAKNETSWAWEIREFERPIRKGIRLRSDFPITVYVLNSKVSSSEGYLAIPVSQWGLDYIVSTYPDFSEQQHWAGGFCVVAAESNTQVRIALRGDGRGLATTSGGRRIGDTIRVSLNEGEVYAVVGNGKTRAEFDLTGTEVRASKPVGVLGFHQRTTIPNLLINGNGRNHLVEMTPPVNRWSDHYVTVEYNRESSNPPGRGDLFRVVCAKSDTKFTYSYYDKSGKHLAGSGGGVLANAGDFIDVTPTSVPAILPYGFSVWEADKPILVSQLSTSATFDGDALHDPFMIHITPISHAVSSTVFQTPTGTQFFRHNLNLIVYADRSTGFADEHLRSIELDGIPLHAHPGIVGSPLLSNHMGGNLHWATIALPSDTRSHEITSDGQVRFVGYVYGYGNVDSYGWPIGYGRAGNATSIDTMPPVIVRQRPRDGQSLYTVDFAVYEIRNIPNPPRVPPWITDQVESGLASIYLEEPVPSNLRLTLVTAETFPGDRPFKDFRFSVRSIDTTLPGSATIVVKDIAGNIARYPITIDAPIRVTPASIDFGRSILGSRPSRTLTVRNPTPFPVTVTDVGLRSGSWYEVSPSRPLPVNLDSNETIELTLTYKTSRETVNYRTDHDRDTLLVFSPDISVKIPITGVAGTARCIIENYPFGIVSAGGLPACRDFIVRNTGSFPLVVNDVHGYENTDFTFTLFPGALDAPLEPSKNRALGLACYAPRFEGHDTARVVVSVVQTEGDDTVSIWYGSTKGAGVDEGPGSPHVTIEQTDDGTLRLRWNGLSMDHITIHDLAGRTVYSARLEDGDSVVSIHVSTWATGLYVATLSGPVRSAMKSFLVTGPSTLR